MKKICVFTGTRAEYGLLKKLMGLVQASPQAELQVLVSGSHLSAAHGMTVAEIEKDGFPIAARVDLGLGDDSPAGICAAMGRGLVGYGKELTRLAPDVLVVLGDRYEALAVASAAAVCRVPVAHVHGGEITRGAMDDSFRHAITKLAHLHFTATEEYRSRVIQLGEDPATVHNVGALGVEAIAELDLAGRAQVEQDLGLDPGRDYFLVTFHPPTLSPGAAREQMAALLAALDRHPEMAVVMTLSGADTEASGVNNLAREYAAARPDRVRTFTSLGQKRYLSALRWCAACVGNSSSGIIEAPSFRVPTVNIGDRQDGRVRAPSVIDCGPGEQEVTKAIARALSDGFRDRLRNMASPYAGGHPSEVIVSALLGGEVDIKKTFYDLPAGEHRA